MSHVWLLKGLLLDKSTEVARLDGISFPFVWSACQTFSIVYRRLWYMLPVLYIFHQE